MKLVGDSLSLGKGGYFKGKNRVIEITKQYAIKADSRYFTICEKRKYKGKTMWQPEFFFTSLEHVFKKLVSLAVAEGIKKGSWEDVSREVSKTQHLIKEKMDILTSIK